MKIYTKTGDTGETSLPGGIRIPKDDPAILAVGAVDELNGALGIALTQNLPGELPDLLNRVQSELFWLGAEIVGAQQAQGAVAPPFVARLESEIDGWDTALPPLQQFILPGGSAGSAQLHAARCICRRAESAVLALSRQRTVSTNVHVYLNRLSDWLFVAARWVNLHCGQADIPWDSQA